MSETQLKPWDPRVEAMNNADTARHEDHYFDFRVVVPRAPFDPVAYMRTGKGEVVAV